MSTFANRHNNSGPMSESDNDDDYEQNSSINQQNESMMHKVKDVVSKLLHPSFLFSAGGDTSRSKRKRTVSIEENEEEKQPEVTAYTTNPTNGHAATAKSKHHRRPIIGDESQLTDDEDNHARDLSPVEQELTDIEQQKKRRRTANYQHIVSTTTTTATTNGNHKDERTSSSSNSTNSVGSLTNRRILDYGPNTTNTTPVLFQTSIETAQNEGINRLISSKQRFNLPSTHRGLTSNYDLSQSPLFSVGSRKTTETTMSPNRTPTNLKSNANEFSANYLLATGLAHRTQLNTTTHNSQSSSTLTNPTTNHTQRLLSTERQMLGVNYACINSRRLPYIERLRRRTLQDCIRLNRTLDSEPLSISTIEEHTSTTASPVRKPVKAPEKECGIQCNIFTSDRSMEPNRKTQRTFPPADIRNEALSVPMLNKPHVTSQTESSIQTNSSITFEPIKDITNEITKPKVLGNITSFSWPKFARAQEEYARKYPGKCRADAVPTQTPKPFISSVAENSTVNASFSTVQSTNGSSTLSKMPIFGVSPPRSTKSNAESIWTCPSCTMKHPSQTASCSLCHGINPSYKRLCVIETPSISTSTIEKPPAFSKLPDIIVEEPVVFTPRTTAVPIPTTPITTFSFATTTNDNLLSIPSGITSSSWITPTSTLPLFDTTPSLPLPVTTKESTIINPPVVTTAPSLAPFPSMTTPLFGAPASTLNPFPIVTNNNSTFSSFGSSTSSNTTTASSTLTTTVSLPATISTFGSFTSTPTTTAVTSIASTIALQKPPLFPFGTSSSAPSLTALASSSSSSSTITTTPFTSNLFSFTSNPTTSATTVTNTTLPVPSTTGGFSFTNSFPLASTSSIATTTTTINTTTTSAPSLFGSGSSSLSGFSFPPVGATTTTTTSTSTPFAFGASSPPRPFAPPVISSSSATATHAFGSTATFGIPSTSAPSFLAFGSSNPPAAPFGFGASLNPAATNSIQTSVASTGLSSGFPFSTPSSSSSVAAAAAAPATVFGAPRTSSFGFGGTPSFSFGAGPTAPTSDSPFQFSGLPPVTASNPLTVPGCPTSDANPFSVGEDPASRRAPIKARRRAK